MFPMGRQPESEELSQYRLTAMKIIFKTEGHHNHLIYTPILLGCQDIFKGVLVSVRGL